MYTIYIEIILDILIALVYTIIVKGRRNRETDTPKKNIEGAKKPLDKLSKLCYNKITKDKEIVAHYEVWEKVSKK